MHNFSKLRKCSCRYEAEQCVPEPGAAGININSMGSWLAIYIWLMSNKYKHQIQVFFYSSPLLAKYFPSPNTSPLFLLQSLSRIRIKDQFADLSGPFGLVYHENIEIPNCDHSHQLQWCLGGISLGRRKGRPVATICHPLSDRLGLSHLYLCFYLYLYFCYIMAFSLRPTQTITFVFDWHLNWE